MIDVWFGAEGVIVSVGLRRRRRVCSHCGQTGRQLEIHDRRIKRWRHLDLGANRCVQERIGDKRVMSLVKAFLRGGILTEHAGLEDSVTGTPQGGILSPCLANIALSALDQHYARAWMAMGSEWERRKRRARGEPTFRLVRYADDCVPRTWRRSLM